MPRCPNCESHLSDQYLRVHGDNNDEIRSCVHCGDLKGKPHHIDPEELGGLP
jgi:Zn ribbon nucleic-acid-binding protein